VLVATAVPPTTVTVAATVPVVTGLAVAATVPVTAAVTLTTGLPTAGLVALGIGSTGGDGSTPVGCATGAFWGAYCEAALDEEANTKAAMNRHRATVKKSPRMVVITRKLLGFISSLLVI
jgi:hypothetical protein